MDRPILPDRYRGQSLYLISGNKHWISDQTTSGNFCLSSPWGQSDQLGLTVVEIAEEVSQMKSKYICCQYTLDAAMFKMYGEFKNVQLLLKQLNRTK